MHKIFRKAAKSLHKSWKNKKKKDYFSKDLDTGLQKEYNYTVYTLLD